MTVSIPTTAAPEAVIEAVEALETAEARLVDARSGRQAAEAALREAASLDRAALQKRLAADPESRPSREHRDRAQAELDEAVEVEQACAANVESALDAASDAVLRHLDDWTSALTDARAKSDTVFSKSLSKLREAEAARAQLRGVEAWIETIERRGALGLKGGAGGTERPTAPVKAVGGTLGLKDPRNSDQQLSVSHALSLLEAYGRTSSVAGEAEAAEQRAQQEAERAERAAAYQQAQVGIIGRES